MEDYLIIALMLVVLVFVICNPIVVATLIYLCNRTQKYLVPAIAGVSVHVASLTLIGLLFLLRESDSVGDLLQSFEGEYIALYLIAVALNGLLITTAALLTIRERRLNQTAPSKLSILYMLFFIAIWALYEAPLTDGLGNKLFIYYQSLTQGPEAEFYGYTIYLGDSYIYEDSDRSLIIQKLNPGFGQVDDDFYLWFDTESAEMEKSNAYWCQKEEYICEHGERKNYRVTWRTHSYPDEDYSYTSTMYYNPKCDVFMGHRGKDPEGQYTELVERFFNGNCT